METPKNENRERLTTSSITRLPDGTVCVGDGCARLKIPPKGNIELDFSECPEDIKKTIAGRVIDGAATEYVSKPGTEKK
jgi:hypothetical protein